ncbi:unnamed protein product [Heterobilharzia americana]|nr:unnamed protein product [Heterobilharzia americana]
MNIMMELRKCCNHPFLIKGAEDAILSEAQSNDDTLNEDELAFQTMVYASGKLVLIHKLLPKLRADGHKVLIFSQMIRVLDILEDYLVIKGKGMFLSNFEVKCNSLILFFVFRFQFERIDGRIHGPLRQEAIDRFSVDPDKFVFLLCTKAGGLGINLTAADVVIIYDSDWNPQNDLQAQARCHRIGQQKMVKVYRLITRNTYEREMFDRASLKLGLDRAVLQSMGSKEARQAQMSKKEIEDLLKKGAYGALMDDDKAGEDFCEEDIDQILQSRARVVQLEQGKENSTFSKATFSMSDNRSDIALDDPNFWQKWAKKAGVDETALAMKDLIVQTPRQRRQTSRYSSMVVNEPPNIPSPASFNMSDFEDNANSNSSGDETVIQSSSGRCRSRRNRKNARLSRKSQNTVVKQDKLLVVKECDANAGNDLNLIEPLDRADLFRVERCLLTWSWGQWEQAVSAVSFKRSMQPSDLAYFSCALLDYILRCLPSNSDIRTRAICETLARPGTWKLDIHQVNIAVSEASAKIKCIPPSVPVNMESENFDGQAPILDQNINELSEVKKNDDAVLLSDAVIDVKSCIDSPVPSEYNATGSPVSVVTAPTDASNTSVTKLASADTENIHNKIESIPDMPSEPLEVIGKDDILDKDEDDVDEETHVKTEETQMSPRLAAFKPELLQPNESFKKHCEIIGIKSAQDLIASRLSHTDFPELALSLPPLEVLDSDLPALWWDKCCDKCLLLGIMKHGWEKYTAMRLDPKLCFRLRAIEVIQSQCSNIPNVSNDHLQEIKNVSDDVLLSLPFPQVADLNSRARKLVGYFQRIKNQLGSDASRCLPKVDVEEAVTCLPFTRLAEAKVLKWTRREEADFYRVVSSFGVEFTEITPDTASNVDGNGDGDQQDEKPNLVIDVDNTETKLHKSLPRKYNWINFRQLANLSRKSDQALVEYFQSFYRMCQRVCKKELTVFAEPASTFATTTTSGSSDLGCEIIIDPISEERASRCLSRIDLLARIRNHILQHPHLEERLKLCQSSSDLPVWWIPGKHDRELLFAAAKYGLARTDLNFLQDSDSSFSRIVHLIREKLTHDPAVTDYPGDLSASPANRYSIAAAAASAARAAAVQLVNEKTTCPTDPPACDTGVSKSDTEDNLDSKKSEIQSSAISLNCQESGSVKTDNELTSVTFEPIGSHDVVTTPSDFTAASNENDAPLNTNGLTLMMDKSDINATTSKEDHSDVKVGQESTAAEWSIKFATNLAISWPKDRTVQHRLELICHTVENNEWPNPHRFITPITTAIPVASSIANCTRSQNESKVTCVDGTIPTNFRSLPSSRDPFTISSNNSRRLPVNNAHVSLSRKQYGLPVFSSDITSNSLPVDSACDSQSSSLTEMSLPLSNNELDESRQFDFCFTGRHINSPLCKPSLHSYTSEALSLTSKTMDAGECISTSVNIPLDIKDNQLSFPSNSTHEIPFSDRNRGRNRNRSSRVNSLGKTYLLNMINLKPILTLTMNCCHYLIIP